jgi:hypothetical protein
MKDFQAYANLYLSGSRCTNPARCIQIYSYLDPQDWLPVQYIETFCLETMGCRYVS